MELLIGWTALSLTIGLLARLRSDSFLVGFVSSMVLSPLVGFALIMLKLPSRPKSSRQQPTTAIARL